MPWELHVDNRCWTLMYSWHICFTQVTGFDGAAEIARILLRQGVRFEFIHDEGTTVLQDVVKGLQQPLAM